MDDITLELGVLEPPLSDDLDHTHHHYNPIDNDNDDNANYNHIDDNNNQNKKEEFCTVSNFDSAANYINLMLTAEGYPVPLKFKSNDDQDACKIINCFEAVITDKNRLVQELNQMNQTIHDLKREQEQLQAKLHKTNQEFEGQKRENAQLRGKNESSAKSLKAEANQNRLLKEELSKAKHNMQYMKTQYAHETRKHEQEQAKTRDRLYKLMDERHKTNMASMTINDTLPGIDAYDQPAVSDERTMYSDLLKKSSDREKAARIENEGIRTILLDIYGTAVNLLKRQVENYKETFPAEISKDDLPVLRLPLEIGGKEATKRVHDLLARLREEWDRQIAKRKAYSEEDIVEKDRLIERLSQSNDGLVEAIEQIKIEYEHKASSFLRYEEGGFFDYAKQQASADLSDSESSALEDIPDRTSQLKKLQKEALLERRRVTEAAIKLGDERTKLSAERWAFEEMKRQFQLCEIMADESSPAPTTPAAAVPSEQEPSGSKTRRRMSYQEPEGATQERSNKRLRLWLGHAPLE
ncbi:Afadin and alpha-actinin-binding-domain-containing protein [Zychaea mexicana]|uniref:Afadin and alpha-actinin-binding-domain-containing protein n=1 Tax=Zychaea mexicana TaxID=64656 RepID=UPI0022FF1CD7|nr:Afadin and alpha-actinin-binding-domain-containing protein [Zychaea mexicana]KAI9494864.1 Afadin and alpha-actinin-binding-domain-containing protein [Zychaea mexicana]